METTGTHTRHEIESQPEAWAAAYAHLEGQSAALDGLVAAGGYDSLLFTGCGSTYYLAIAAAAVAQQVCGLPARGLPASELWLDLPAARVGRKPLLVAVSRSGATTETSIPRPRHATQPAGSYQGITCRTHPTGDGG